MPLVFADNTPAISPPPVAPGVDASAHLEHRLFSRWDDIRVALGGVHFYMELGLVALALGFAWLTGNYIRQKIERRLTISPPQHIDIELITKPLQLMVPLLTLPFLWVVQGLAAQFDIGGEFTGDVLELCYAYLLMRCVLMAIKQKPVAWLISAAIIVNAVRARRVFSGSLRHGWILWPLMPGIIISRHCIWFMALSFSSWFSGAQVFHQVYSKAIYAAVR